jgi:hypothetical protein
VHNTEKRKNANNSSHYWCPVPRCKTDIKGKGMNSIKEESEKIDIDKKERI